MALKWHKPKHKVQSLKVDRKNKWNFEATWKVPSDATSDKAKDKTYNYRFTELYVTWRVNEKKVKTKRDPRDKDVKKNERATSDTFNLDSFVSTRPKNKSFKRTSFYPNGPKVSELVVSVAGANSAGAGDAVSKSYEFKLPKAPKVSWSYDSDNGSVTVKVVTDEGAGNAERYDTMVRTVVKLGSGMEQQLMGWTATQKTEWTHTYQVANYSANFANGQSLVFTAYAYARGLAGDNPSKAKAISNSRTICAPGTPQIKSVTVDTLQSNGMVRVEVDAGKKTGSIQLQRRHGDSGSWEDVDGATEDGSATALYDSVGLAEPVAGEKLYYRLVAERDNYTRVSEPFWAEALFSEAATAQESTVGLVSVTSGDDGASVYAVFGWDDAAPTGTTGGIEVTWSEDRKAWESTNAPSPFELTWQDDVSQSEDWNYTAGVYIRDLEQGKAYYIRGRRYIDSEVGRTYSRYTDFGAGESEGETKIMPVTRPASVTLDGPAFVARGEAIPLTWVFDGDSEQTEYHVFSTDNESSPIAEGYDALGSASVSPDRYGDSDSISLYVMVGAGGALTRSVNDLTVGIADYPTCEVYADETLTAQYPDGAEFEVYCDSADARLICSCTSQGIGGRGALDSMEQFAGDSVWTAAITPSWEEAQWSQTSLYSRLAAERTAAQTALAEAQTALDALDPQDEGYQDALVARDNAQTAYDAADANISAHTGSIYVATVNMDSDTDFADTASYDLTVYAIDQRTGLRSESDSTTFTVDWAHQAPDPSDAIEVSVDTTARTATIALAAPSGAEQTDVYDIYRGTASGFDLIARAVALDAVVTDRHASFGEQSYRIQLRTADGDTAYSDYTYELGADVTRFDWPDGFVELDKSLSFSDSFEKDFEQRSHMDGSIGGGFNPAIGRSGSYTAKVIKELEPEVMASLMAMGEHAGTVYVRRHDGHAFECDAELDLDNRKWSMLADPSIKLSRVSLTERYMIAVGDIQGAETDETGE